MKVLIVEDEAALMKAVGNFLAAEGYVCELAANFSCAYDKLSVYEYDIFLVDIGLPDGNGLDLLGDIRKYQPGSGVIIISAKDSLDDRISGLDLGADDYITKPFYLSELNSRMKAVIRRRKFMGDPLISFHEFSINTESKTVSINGKELSLTKKEYDLILFFITNRNRVLTKESIAEHLWDDQIDMADNFDFIYTHLNNIRKKIRNAGGCDYIKTIYGMGYKLLDK